MFKKLVSFIFLGAWLDFIPMSAHACAVCFGGASSNLTRGFFWGIVVLLLLPFVLIGIITTLIIRSTKKQHAN